MRFTKVLFAVALSVALASSASAQGYFSASKPGTEISGITMPVWNTTDSLISDGLLVCADTTTAAIGSGGYKRQAVRAFLPASHGRYRVLGIAAGNIARSSQGGAGKVLIFGYHPRALMAASSGVTAFGSLKISLSVEGCLTAADSAATSVGFLYGYNAGTVARVNGAVGPRYSAKVWWKGTGPYGGP